MSLRSSLFFKCQFVHSILISLKIAFMYVKSHYKCHFCIPHRVFDKFYEFWSTYVVHLNLIRCHMFQSNLTSYDFSLRKLNQFQSPSNKFNTLCYEHLCFPLSNFILSLFLQYLLKLGYPNLKKKYECH